MGRAARLRAESEYTLDQMARRMEAWYRLAAPPKIENANHA
jgi:hypothetical protein